MWSCLLDLTKMSVRYHLGPIKIEFTGTKYKSEKISIEFTIKCFFFYDNQPPKKLNLFTCLFGFYNNILGTGVKGQSQEDCDWSFSYR